MKIAYIYPVTARGKASGLHNPYMDDFIRSMSNEFSFINVNKPSRIGILDLVKYLGKVDYIFFNWIEKLPENKGGKFQTLILFILVRIFKKINTSIVWTMHNKLSHSGKHTQSTRSIIRFMLTHADVVLAHSKEGLVYGNYMKPGSSSKIVYFPHPVKDRRSSKPSKKKYDVLIWGTLSPYKGIDKFLEYMDSAGLINRYKILIAGKSTSDEHLKRIEKYARKNIELRNEFISDSQLATMIAESEYVLNTYSMDSILSSGVLMDSLGYGARIIGPHVGAFADLAEENIIQTFKDFSEIDSILQQNTESNHLHELRRIEEFLKKNSWEQFATNFTEILRIKAK